MPVAFRWFLAVLKRVMTIIILVARRVLCRRKLPRKGPNLIQSGEKFRIWGVSGLGFSAAVCIYIYTTTFGVIGPNPAP